MSGGCTHTGKGKPQFWLAAKPLISWRAAEIPGTLDRWHTKCLTVSQPHNDTPFPSAWVSKFAGEHTLANGVIMIEREREGGGEKKTFRANHFFKILASPSHKPWRKAVGAGSFQLGIPDAEAPTPRPPPPSCATPDKSLHFSEPLLLFQKN
jgi:hypothetical protein